MTATGNMFFAIESLSTDQTVVSQRSASQHVWHPAQYRQLLARIHEQPRQQLALRNISRDALRSQRRLFAAECNND